MPTPNVADTLRHCDSLILNGFNEARKVSPFEGLVRRKKAPDGVAKFAATFIPAAFKQFTGEAQPVGVDARNLTVTTVKHKNPIEIDEKQLRNSEAIMGEEFKAPFRQLGADAVHAEDEALSQRLEANSNDLFGSAFFASAAAIPNSSQTVTNTQSATGSITDPDDVRTDFYAGLALWDLHKNAAGRFLHGTRMAAAKPVILFHPNNRAVFEEVFEMAELAGGGSNPTYKRAELRPNPYFSDTNDWFMCVPPSLLAYPILFLAHDYDTPPMQTNWGKSGGEPGSMVADRSLILSDKVLFNADWDFQTAMGWRFGVIRTVVT